MIRKGFVSLGVALKAAQWHANDCGDTFRVWRRITKSGAQRFDILDLDETPKGEGWEMVRELAPEADEKR